MDGHPSAGNVGGAHGVRYVKRRSTVDLKNINNTCIPVRMQPAR